MGSCVGGRALCWYVVEWMQCGVGVEARCVPVRPAVWGSPAGIPPTHQCPPSCSPSPCNLTMPHPPSLPQLSLANISAGVPLDGFMIQLNRNALGLAPASQHVALGPGGAALLGWGDG